MIDTLLLTIVTEGLVVIGYCLWHKKRVRPILFTSICANMVTQSILWVALNLFFRQYIATLLISEVLIWFLEAVCFYFVRTNQLNVREAMSLSMYINLVSFALGWFFAV